jgi:hypothetical protein
LQIKATTTLHFEAQPIHTSHQPPQNSQQQQHQNGQICRYNLDRAHFLRDVGMTTITAQGYTSALSLFDHFLVKVLNEEKLVDMQLDELDADVEDIL